MLSQHLIDFAQALADEASAMIAARASQALGTSAKNDKTFVTELDLAIEARLRERINAAYPQHGILGEEYGSEGLDAEWVWTLDPIDGTMALVAGIPVYSTLISLCCEGKPVLGVMHFPAIQSRWVGVKGMRTTCNGEPCQVRTGAFLHDAIQTVSSPDFFKTPEQAGVLQAVSAATAWRVYGAAALSYGRLAMGRTDIALDAGLKVYDYAPFVPIIEGAGGTITDWAGQALGLRSHDQVLAAGDERRHAAALAIISQHTTKN